MSSLIFHTQEDQVLVATDTLAVSVGGRALMFTTKVLIVPHLRMMMAGTGAGGFLDRWFVRVNSGKVVAGIDNLDYHTPKSLADLWREFKKKRIHWRMTKRPRSTISDFPKQRDAYMLTLTVPSMAS